MFLVRYVARFVSYSGSVQRFTNVHGGSYFCTKSIDAESNPYINAHREMVE